MKGALPGLKAALVALSPPTDVGVAAAAALLDLGTKSFANAARAARDGLAGVRGVEGRDEVGVCVEDVVEAANELLS